VITTSTEHRGTPTWFGPQDRPIFGWVHVPEHPNGHGVVLCPSIGLEGEASQMAYRGVARPLVDAGCTVLRFDYRGTGDSSGMLTDPGRLDEWTADIAECLSYLRGAGATRTHLVGARLGATLAAHAASALGGVASLTLWYPWTKGSQFLRYQRAIRRLYAVSDRARGDADETEIPGFVLDAATTADLKGLDTSAVGPGLPAEVLVIDVADPETGEVVRTEFGPDGCVRGTGTGADALFGVELMKASVSAGDIATIAGFILGQPAADVPVGIEPVVRPSAIVDGPGGVPVTERAVFFGDGLFGMLAEPADRSAGRVQPGQRLRTSAGPVPPFGAAVFLNAGSLHHVGPGRQWVELSRKWAAAGIRCLRMDLGGIGESPMTGPEGILPSYPLSARDDVAAGVQFLAPDDPKQVLLLGLCAGAFHSLLAAPTIGVGGVAVLNPLRLPSTDPGSSPMGDLIEGAPRGEWDDPEGTGQPAVQADPPAPRRRFLGNLRDKGVFTPLARRMPDRIWWAARLGKGGKDPVEALQRVVDSGTSLYVVLGPDEWPGIGRGRTHELRRLARSGIFAITFVPTLDHSFHVASGRELAVAALDEWVLGTGSGGSDLPREATTIS
jgi:alpha-beta hydrolase superfamily lysophospholipase